VVVVVGGGAQEEQKGHTFLTGDKQQAVCCHKISLYKFALSFVHMLRRYAYRPTGISKICYLDFNITDFMDWVWLVYQLLGIWA
jgi:uncharacterized protein YprB with RNaseH-like and TPR domain